MQKRILIIHPEGNIHNNPNLYAIVKKLCELGYFVDVFSILRPGIFQGIICDNCEHILFNNYSKVEITVGFVSFLSLPAIDETHIINFVQNTLKKYDLVIGVDRGIIEASIIAMVQKIPLGLISYEIFFADETGDEFKVSEINACKNLSFAICQDDVRTDKLSVENKISKEKIFRMPVINQGFHPHNRSYFLNDKLGIPKDKKIALYAGTLSKWSGTEYLINSVQYWSNEWVLVIHARYPNDSFMEKLQLSSLKEKVFFSYEPYNSISELTELLEAVDLGIAYYHPTNIGIYDGKNLEFIGLASGKIFTYLQNGLPVCLNQIGELSNLIEMYNIGLVYDKNTPFVLTIGNDQLEYYKQNIPNIVPKVFDFEELFRPIERHIASIVNNVPNNAAGEQNFIKSTNINKLSYPKISIVTASFNQEIFLEECIDSILSQNYPNLEYIVMDGGSSDNSIEIIKKHSDHIDFWQSKPDGGQYAALNGGFNRSTGTIMSWLNSDDKYHPYAFFKVADIFLSAPDVLWLTGRSTFWNKNNGISHITPFVNSYDLNKFLSFGYDSPYIQQESTFWRRELWNLAGAFLSPDLNFAGDLDLWMRFFRITSIFTVDSLFGGYRMHGNQKATLSFDKYKIEADGIINREREYYQNNQSLYQRRIYENRTIKSLDTQCKLDLKSLQKLIENSIAWQNYLQNFIDLLNSPKYQKDALLAFLQKEIKGFESSQIIK